MTRELTLSTLAAELSDFLGLPEDLDLPALYSIDLKRTQHSGWSVRAFVAGRTDAESYAAVEAWARYAGGTVTVGRPYVAGNQPSGMQRTVSTRILVAEVPIEVAGAIDALFAVPQREQVGS